MHGRPRKPARAENAAASAAKSAHLRDLQSQLLHNHHNHIYTKEAVAASVKLVEINPEVYTAWNFRKLALQHNLGEVGEDKERVKALVDDELRTVEVALRRNPKSYGAWHHRKWVLSRGLAEVDFGREFRLLDQLLKLDPRNFHGWNYRRFIAKLKNMPEVEELNFTMDMINTNFSNYSAWHNRSILLSHLLEQRAQGFDKREKIFTEEYDLVRQALFTDPDDQSGWFYHLWLLDQTLTHDPVLISSWPLDGSDWVLSVNANLKSSKLFPSSSSNGYYSLHTGYLPIVLHFNQAVIGLNSSTVTVDSVFANNEDLTWRPLSNSKSGEARCWVTFLKISNVGCSNLSACSVVVNIGHSPGIISSRGSCFNHPLQIKFIVNVKATDMEQTEGECVDELVSWTDAGVDSAKEDADLIAFDQLSITKDHVLEGKWNLETITNEITLFKELSEENCKFVNLTLARLLIAHDALMSHKTPLETRRIHSEEISELLDSLTKVDSSHARYYTDQRSLVLMNQATFDKEFMMKHCWHFSKSTSSGLDMLGCLRLNNLSLTRIGFVERLLWVQMLDLRHNELRSVEGLEALQLLTCLNLSNNRISSFTALEPLKLLSSLKVLDVSFNEIGSHPVDTTTYLCASPLSHTIDDDLIIKEYRKDGIKVEDYWEAILLFKEMLLWQLDIRGNAAVDDGLRGTLAKVLPTLKWIDGTHV